jgi:hypothetical protein
MHYTVKTTAVIYRSIFRHQPASHHRFITAAAAAAAAAGDIIAANQASVQGILKTSTAFFSSVIMNIATA